MTNFSKRYNNYYIIIDKCNGRYNVKTYKNDIEVHNLLCDDVKISHFNNSLSHVYLYKIGYRAHNDFVQRIETFYVIPENIKTKCYVEKTIYGM